MVCRTKRGFSLIELLVVIAIIAVLAAILFPLFVSAKESSKKSACQNNLKQIGAALSMYTSDNNDRYPKERACYVPLELLSISNTVHGAVEPLIPGLVYSMRNYVKNPKIWSCPSGAQWTPPNTAYDNPRGVLLSSLPFRLVTVVRGPGIRETSCNYTSWCFNRPMTDKDLAGMRSDGYTEPSDPKDFTYTHLCNRETNARGKTPAEYASGHKHNFGAGGTIIPGPLKMDEVGKILTEGYSPRTSQSKPFYAHSRGQNILFYDGRVRWTPDHRSSYY